MNMIQVQNDLKQLADNQLVQELNSPTGMAPSFLVLGELKRRKDLRSTTSGPEPQGSMAEEYSKGLMSQGPQDLYSALSQARASGQPVNYGGGQINAAPQGYADGGGIEYMTPYERRLRELADRSQLKMSGPYSQPKEPLGVMLLRERFQRAMGIPQTDAFTKLVGEADPLQPRAQITEEEIYDQPAAPRTTTRDALANRETVRGIPAAQEPPMVRRKEFEGYPVYPPPNEATGTGQAIPVAPENDPLVEPPAGPRGGPRGGGGQGGGGGLATARSAGPRGLAEWMAQVRGLGMPDRFGELSLENQNAKEELKRSRDQDAGLAILSAGLGIMGGTSPYAAVNIGQGAQQGVKTWNESSKEHRLAMQGLRQADQQIAIAQANRDEKQLESALKMKMHWEETMQRSLDRQAASGNASADRAAAREERAADRKEGQMLREQSVHISLMNERRQEIKGLDAMIANPMLSDEQKKVFMEQRKDAAEELSATAQRLKQLQGERDKRVGRETPEPKKSTPKPTLRYNPATGKVEPI